LEARGYGKGGVEPPHSKALRAFSCFLGARQPTGMSDCFENTQGEIPRAALDRTLQGCAGNDSLEGFLPRRTLANPLRLAAPLKPRRGGSAAGL
jgi:hypothetical protein